MPHREIKYPKKHSYRLEAYFAEKKKNHIKIPGSVRSTKHSPSYPSFLPAYTDLTAMSADVATATPATAVADATAAAPTVVSADGVELQSLPRTSLDYINALEKQLAAFAEEISKGRKAVQITRKEKISLDKEFLRKSKKRTTRKPNHKPVAVSADMIAFMNEEGVSGTTFLRPVLLKTIHNYISAKNLKTSRNWAPDAKLAALFNIPSDSVYTLIGVNTLLQKHVIPASAATAPSS
jgi:hypothetical protein